MKRSGKFLLAGGFSAFICCALYLPVDTAREMPGLWVLYGCFWLIPAVLFSTSFFYGLRENRGELADFSTPSILSRLSCIFRLIACGLLALFCGTVCLYFLLRFFDRLPDFSLPVFVLHGVTVALAQLGLSGLLWLFARGKSAGKQVPPKS